MEVYAGAAVAGMFAGAVLGQATGRVVTRTLDLAFAGAGRAYENLIAKDPNDPETRKVFHALHDLDVNSRLRMAEVMIQGLNGQVEENGSETPLALCIKEVKLALKSIEECLDGIGEELEEHERRFLHKWRSSNVDEHLLILGTRLSILDKRLDMLMKCHILYGQAPKNGNGST